MFAVEPQATEHGATRPSVFCSRHRNVTSAVLSSCLAPVHSSHEEYTLLRRHQVRDPRAQQKECRHAAWNARRKRVGVRLSSTRPPCGGPRPLPGPHMRLRSVPPPRRAGARFSRPSQDPVSVAPQISDLPGFSSGQRCAPQIGGLGVPHHVNSPSFRKCRSFGAWDGFQGLPSGYMDIREKRHRATVALVRENCSLLPLSAIGGIIPRLASAPPTRQSVPIRQIRPNTRTKPT